MNTKDESITDLVCRLRKELGSSFPEIIDYWEADLFAIGFKREDRMIYVATFNYRHVHPARYDIDLEILSQEEPDNLQVVREDRNISFEQLLTTLRNFLAL
ncbi:MAG: hypothetical protein P0Y53_05795 [Candidatus Pseudobacter hemicellulosilyticus]|uniref:Uncharacterized protein n=1 Tax=Candidatus Pseudobacter hemicellulosilyticus TaxID=3121375 RepID=A0AAJ6BGS9_9BACT|nr:MAG: hypothetical protein P0Y53_05795 [Pseudobacter sp.]